MSLISRLGVVLGLDAGEFNKNLGIAQQRLQGFSQSIISSRLGVAAIGATFVAAATNAVRFADSINDVAQASELSVQTVLRLNEALVTNGGKSESASQMVTKFSRSVFEANHQNADMQKSFEKLGISMEDLRTKSMEQLLSKGLKGFKELKDITEKTGVAFDIFGKSAKGLDLSGAADAFERNKESYKDAQRAFEAIGNALDNLQKISDTMKTSFAIQIGEAFEYITDKAIAFYNMMAKIKNFLNENLGLFARFVPGAVYMPNQEIATKPKGEKDAEEKINREQELNKDILKRLKMQEENYNNEKRILDVNTERLKKEAQITGLSDLQTRYLMDQFDYQKKLDTEEQKGLLTAERKIELLTKFLDYQAQQKETLKAQQTFSAGWSKAFEEYAEQANNAALMGQQAFISITQNMEQALDNFVRTGKLSFSDLARSIIADLIQIQLKAQATSIFNSLGIGDFFSGIFGGGGSKTAFSGGIKFLADGGPISGPAIVGERGPELFIPKTAGAIIPNNQLSSMMNGGAQIVYNGPYIQNMSAIDTQSGIQFLSKNKETIWSANQSAQRSLPQSR